MTATHRDTTSTWIMFLLALVGLNLVFRVASAAGSAGWIPMLAVPSADAMLLAVIACLHAWTGLPGRRSRLVSVKTFPARGPLAPW